MSNLAEQIKLAKEAYYRGEPIMSDAEFDILERKLRELDPSNPILSQVASPVEAGEAVRLPIPMPSLDKIDESSLPRWIRNHPADMYQIGDKLDGISALWIPAERKLYTHGSKLEGRDISSYVPYIRGLVSSFDLPVRGELIMRENSKYIKEGKLARNIVAGIFARKESSFDKALLGEVEFIAY
jgi:DNA ligase (NAD+)